MVDEDDVELTKLRKQYGPLVANTVGVAALEIATWNPSGRYNYPMPWDFKADQKASMSQICQLLVKTIRMKEKEIKKKEKDITEKDKQLKALIPAKTPAPAPKRRRG